MNEYLQLWLCIAITAMAIALFALKIELMHFEKRVEIILSTLGIIVKMPSEEIKQHIK